MELKKIGDTCKGFILKKIVPLKELNAVLKELEHSPTGARVMQIENADPENLFCLSFETIPYNSDGVAHILEHIVLCGSQKFPIKDPFFSMMRRSLNTYMNALTGADVTCYPAATQVEKDFYNLLEVYLDAVFHPELKQESFFQEGHRLEFTKPDDPKTPLQWKGIVYNEMKGALASAETRLWHAMMERLVPDLTYAHVSGGDPKVIPTLTYEKLHTFHETYYHPSRCLFFFYGNLPLEKHLDFILEKELAFATKLPPLPPMPLQPRFKNPVEAKIAYPAADKDDLDAQTFISLGWLTTPVRDQDAVLALFILDAILMETDGSLLKLPLLKSGLCLSADAYIESEMSEMPYVIVCKGCKKEDASKLEALILKTLEEIIDLGIPSHLVASAIHQLEFSRTEIVGNHSPYGLTLFMRSALSKQHGGEPENALLIHSLFDKLLERARDPKYLPEILRTHLLQNRHRVLLTMVADPKLGMKEEEEEKKALKEIQAALTDEEREKILNNAQALLKYHAEVEEQNISCLPKVDLQDVPLQARALPLREKHAVFHHDCFTNKIVYVDLIFDMAHIEEEDLPYAQLLASILSELGSGKRSYLQNLEYMQAHLGGLGTALSLYIQAENPLLTKPGFIIRGKALYRKAPELFLAMKELVTSVRLDEEKRLEELLLQIHTSLHSQLNRNALHYAMQLAQSGFSSAAHISHNWHGLAYFKAIEEIVKKNDPSFLLEKLIRVKDQLLSFLNPQLVITCDAQEYQKLEKERWYGLLELPQKKGVSWKGNYTVTPPLSQGRIISSPVAFTCEAFKTVSYLHPHAPSLSLASHILDNKILHPKIREQGGAYGCGATYNPMNGHFTFHSYRDPHVARTLQAFRESVESIASGAFDEKDLEEAKLGMIQQFDSPIAPGSRGTTAYTWWREGKTWEMRQNYRENVLHLTMQDVKKAVREELLSRVGEGVIVSFANKELLEKENKILPYSQKPLPIIPI